jgi:hypothetical protein
MGSLLKNRKAPFSGGSSIHRVRTFLSVSTLSMES